MNNRRTLRSAFLASASFAFAFFGVASNALADEEQASAAPIPTSNTPENTSEAATKGERAEQANAAFQEGTRLAREAKWAAALTSFEQTADLLPHPVTTYNIGTCERALGRYVAARETFERALREHASGPSAMPERLVEDTEAYLSEINASLARVRLTIKPADALLAIDGRPVRIKSKKGPVPKAIAGVEAPGPGEPPPAATFDLELDPGRHVFTFQRQGFSDAVVRRDFSTGANPELTLALDKLPAVLRIESNVASSLVTLDGRDLGPTPIVVRRPAGPYSLRVESKGYEPYESEVSARPGEEVDLRVRMVPDEPGLHEQWWFWTTAAAVVAGAAITTYAVTRDDPEPQRQPVNGGSLGWSIPIP